MSTSVPRRQSSRLLVSLLAIAAMPVVASAQGTAEQQEACTPDAVKLCSSAIPDIPKVTACMKAHVAQLSPRCRAAFNDATSAPKPRVATREEPRVTSSPVPRTRHTDARRPDASAPRAKVAVARPDLPAPRRLPRRDDDDAPVAALPETPAPPPETLAPLPGIQAPLLGAQAPLMGTHVPGLSGYRAEIARDCRAGLIDPFTCRNTLQALRSIE